MEKTAIRQAESVCAERVFASDFPKLLEKYRHQVSVLSLDCFDTILFRKTMTPSDVFFELQNSETFKSAGIGASLRASAEAEARKMRYLSQASTEVTLRDIYAWAVPQVSEVLLARLEEEELAAEMKFCYAFPAAIDLMRAASKAGLRLVVVSDTYFQESGLRKLLAATLPDDVYRAIEYVFCSADYRVSKNNGIFDRVISVLSVKPSGILHLGDNIVADYHAPKRHGIHAANFLHTAEPVANLQQLNTSALLLADASVRDRRAMGHIFHGVFASARVAQQESISTAELTGFAVLGPVMYAFASLIQAEIRHLQSSGKTVRTLFLMRDAWLPMLSCEALLGHEAGRKVRISRFTAYAASFRSQQDVDSYLASVITSGQFEKIATQLLLPREVIKKLMIKINQEQDRAAAFIHQIHKKHVLEMIFAASARFRKRLCYHVLNEAGLVAGDTILFVDLGYSGTAQRLLQSVFQEELGVEIRGCYLIQLPVPNRRQTRCGLLDPDHHDYRTLHMLVKWIAMIEQLCTCSEKSVIDYDESGNPVYSSVSPGAEQNALVAGIQRACLDFIGEAKSYFERAGFNPEMQFLRDAALASLTRLLFFPDASEISCLEKFEFDLNVGTNDLFSMINSDKAVASLRSRGVNYMHFEKCSDLFRTNTPAELRFLSLEYGLAQMVQQRFHLVFNQQHSTFRQEKISIIVLRNGKSHQTEVMARTTFDQFYAIYLPVGAGEFQIGVLFGKNYTWIQMEKVELVASSAFMTEHEAANSVECHHCMHYSEMTCHAEGLYECSSPAAFAMFVPVGQAEKMQQAILKIIFRPLVVRK